MWFSKKEKDMPTPVSAQPSVHTIPTPPAKAATPEAEVLTTMWIDPCHMPISLKQGLTTTFHFIVRKDKEAYEWQLDTRWINITGDKNEPIYRSQLFQSPNKLVERSIYIPSDGGWTSEAPLSELLLNTFLNEGSGALLKKMVKMFLVIEEPA